MRLQRAVHEKSDRKHPRDEKLNESSSTLNLELQTSNLKLTNLFDDKIVVGVNTNVGRDVKAFAHNFFRGKV